MIIGGVAVSGRLGDNRGVLLCQENCVIIGACCRVRMTV